MRRWRLAIVGGLAASASMAAAQTPLPPAIDAEIAASDPIDLAGRRFDEYVVDARAGQSVTVTAAPAAGSDLDPVLEIYAPGRTAPLVRDDNSAGGRGARATVPSLANGVYRIRVVGAGAFLGRYRLAIRSTAAALGGVAGGIVGQGPSPTGNGGNELSAPPGAFIICPGHPRCPR
jgi:hypothetical protein